MAADDSTTPIGVPVRLRALEALLFVILSALTIRAALSVGPHSGQGLPPMFGDYEAQRHWMELTTALPVGDWYRQTAANDLQYWGLDYPPLTAFWSWATGRAAHVLTPQLVEWKVSRGAAGEAAFGGKLFMRLTVLLADAIVLVPAALYFAYVVVGLPSRRDIATLSLQWPGVAESSRMSGVAVSAGDPISRSTIAACRVVSAVLLIPSLIVIDHGHFQYNSISLGLALAAAALLLRGRWLISAVAFALALNYKQMLLYFAPAFFVYLLAVSWRGGLTAVLGRPGCESATIRSAKLEGAAGRAACEGDDGSDHNTAPDRTALLRSSNSAAEEPPAVHSGRHRAGSVLRRRRGGPASSAAETSTGQRPSANQRAGLGASAHRSCGTGPTWSSFILAVACIGAVVAAVFAMLWAPFCLASPPEVGCAGGLQQVLRRLFPFDRNIFEDKVSNVWCVLEPLLRWRSRLANDGSALADLLVTRRSKVALACAGTTALLMFPSLVLLWRRVSTAAGTGTLLHAQQSRGVHRLAGHLCLCLLAVSLSFFLASFQVHEKSVLMPALAAACAGAVGAAPLLSLFVSALAQWTMWPLLAKDGLVLQAVALSVLHVLLVAWPHGGLWAAAQAEAATILTGWRGRASTADNDCAVAPSVDDYVGGGERHSHPAGSDPDNNVSLVAAGLLAVAGAVVVAAAAVSVEAAMRAPPAGLPDLYPYLSAVVGCSGLAVAWLWATMLQAGL
jgi:hypothetical protein